MNNILQMFQDLQFRDIEEAYSHSCQLIILLDNGIPKSHGTGIFIEVENNFFLVTAAHVIDNKTNNLYIPIDNNNLLSPGGDVTFTDMEKNRKNDKIDIAIFKLCSQTISKISSFYKFLPQSQLGINHKVKHLPLYTTVGFPSSKSKVHYKKNEFQSQLFFYTTIPAERDIYAELERDVFSNMIVNYDKNKVYSYSTSAYKTGPDSYGMSGCGLWFSDATDIATSGKNKRLVAIMTDWPIKNRKYWIGTKIDVITEIIRKKYKLNLPQSNILNINHFE